jgi:hypothetical protein
MPANPRLESVSPGAAMIASIEETRDLLAKREAAKQKQMIDALTMQNRAVSTDLQRKRLESETKLLPYEIADKEAQATERRARAAREDEQAGETREKVKRASEQYALDESFRAKLSTDEEFMAAAKAGDRHNAVARMIQLGVPFDKSGQIIDHMLGKDATATGGTQEVYRQNPRTGTIEKVGAVPKGSHFMTEPAPKVTVNAAPLAPNAKDMIARAVAKGDTTAIASAVRGRGAAATGLATEILNRAAQYDPGSDSFIDTAAPLDWSTNRAIRNTTEGALRKETSFNAATKRAARTALANADLVMKANVQVGRTDMPFVNAIAQRFAKGASSTPGLTDFEVKIYTFAREYAKVVSGSAASIAGLTDTAAKEAASLFNAAQTPDTLKAAIEAAQADMDNVISQSDTTVQGLTDTLRGGQKPAGKKSAQQLIDQYSGGGGDSGPSKPTAEDLIKKYGGK